MFLHADSEDSDQIGRLPRLVWVLTGSQSLCWFCREVAHLSKIRSLLAVISLSRTIKASEVDDVESNEQEPIQSNSASSINTKRERNEYNKIKNKNKKKKKKKNTHKKNNNNNKKKKKKKKNNKKKKKKKKKQKKKKKNTSGKPRGQPFHSRWPQGCPK